MTPYGQRPLDLGADAVVAADTKAPNGHSDVLFGHVTSRNAEIIAAVKDWRRLAGAIPGPFEAWLVHRGLETLEVRFDRMCSSAEAIATRLAAHRAVGSVRYPGLPDDPSQQSGPRADGSLRLPDRPDASRRTGRGGLHQQCALIQPATSFGGVHTSAERRARWGDAVAPGYVRLSVGCEPLEELWKAHRAIAGFRSSALGTRAQRQASAFHRVAYWCSADDAYDMKHRHAALAAQREAIVGQ